MRPDAREPDLSFEAGSTLPSRGNLHFGGILGLQLPKISLAFVGHLPQCLCGLRVVDHFGQAAALLDPPAHFHDQFDAHVD
jgi:hypothetical protein